MRCRKTALVLGFLLLPAAHLAQTTGDISGRVTDASGTPLPGVVIEATSSSLPGTRRTVTAGDGLYRVPAIPPGTYHVVATLPGFRPVESACTVSLGSEMTVDLTLRLEAEEQVVVSGEPPRINTTTTTTGTNYTSGVIAHLPVDRNYADIVRSNPGVSTDKGDKQGRSLALAIYGATSAESQWIIDGVSTTNALKGTQGKAINNEFVQEVEVKTGGYQAEYGRAMGGVINVITKSGGNAFHGDGFVYYDNGNTAAARKVRPEDSVTEDMRVDDQTRYDYGADLGGFLVRDRLWFFGAYNRVTLDGHVSRITPNVFVSTDDQFPFDAADNLFSGKLTWNIAPSTSLVGTVFGDPSSTSGAAGADPRQGQVHVNAIISSDPSTWFSTRTQGGTDFGIRLTQLFGSQALATLQGSYHKDRNTLGAPDGIRTTDLTCAGGTLDKPCALPPEPHSIQGGYGQIGGGDRNASSRQQYAATFGFYAGDHEIKGGGDYLDGRTSGAQLITGEQFVFILNQWGPKYYQHQFFAAGPQDPTPIPGVRRGAQVLDYGGYVSDSWKPAPGLTINAGLRWDGETTRDYTGQTVLHFTDGWQPRLGIAWDPWRDGRTKAYAFAGRFSYALPTEAALTTFAALSLFRTWNFDPVSVVQDPTVPHHPTARGGGGAFGVAVDEGVQGPYQDELTVGIERLLTPSLTVGLKGTYRRLGRALETRCDLDYNNPVNGGNQCAVINPGSNAKFASGNAPSCNGLVDDPDWYQCTPTAPAAPAAKRLYRGIELLAREALGDRLWLQASYIYSSLRGNYDGGINEVFGETRPGLNSDYDYPALAHNAYGTLTLDRPHQFRLDGYWVTPLRLTVGLQTFVVSGTPFNKLGYFNNGYEAAIYLLPRGSAGRLPTLWEANLTLAYPIPIGPMTATLQAYLFNVFNNQTAVSTDEGWTIVPPDGFPATIYDPNQAQNNPNYGKVTARYAPRSFRMALRVSF
ncbi:MAG TPA: carboxypeptidase regulatory-like domain-containing protein [Thermoanaerobaculia bacterium]|nr:carboxypeptidase regulatory-like domain-containing protein [Thermoanaerobaculia bacterium]